MTHATVVRYTTRPDSAEENDRLIRAVFDQLASETPDGVRYIATRLDDGVTFVHVALVDDPAVNPLTSLTAFRDFVSAINERVVDGPTAANGHIVGSYGVEPAG